MGLNWEFTGGETPLDPDEIDGLRIPLVTARAELDEHEQANIQRVRLAKWLDVLACGRDGVHPPFSDHLWDRDRT